MKTHTLRRINDLTQTAAIYLIGGCPPRDVAQDGRRDGHHHAWHASSRGPSSVRRKYSMTSYRPQQQFGSFDSCAGNVQTTVESHSGRLPKRDPKRLGSIPPELASRCNRGAQWYLPAESPVSIRYDLYYDGQKVQWRGKGMFWATSGLPGYQSPSQQCLSEAGPIPEGSYYVLLRETKDRAAGNIEQCRLFAASYLQAIPRGQEAGDCESVWMNWGRNRIRLFPATRETERACSPRRNGFYLHDSTKGFSHGCIEIEGNFFAVLRNMIRAHVRSSEHATEKRLYLLVKYVPWRATNGGTEQP
jgi:hypothetical protein